MATIAPSSQPPAGSTDRPETPTAPSSNRYDNRYTHSSMILSAAAGIFALVGAFFLALTSGPLLSIQFFVSLIPSVAIVGGAVLVTAFGLREAFGSIART